MIQAGGAEPRARPRFGLTLPRVLVAWAAVTAIASGAVHHAFTLDVDETHPQTVVASVWWHGQLVARAPLAKAGDASDALTTARTSHPGSTLVYESVVAEGPVLPQPPIGLALSFVPGRDGMAVTFRGRTEYLTPDDLLAKQAYDKGLVVPGAGVAFGLDMALAEAALSDRFDAPARDVMEHGRIRRIRVVRSIPDAPPPRVVTPETLTRDDARRAVLAAGAFLARGVDAQGRYRYLIDAPTNQTLAGYDWPRHAGATYFLAQAAALSHDPDVAWAALRAASWLRDHALLRCGPYRCIGEGDQVDVGSAGLTVLAFVEIARTGLDPGYALYVPDLTAFLRAQQRPDGEFMHLYDRAASRPVDVQLLYYTGEAALALARAHGLLGDPRDLDAATRALARLVGPAWHFFGDRYYFGEEHWTCQAMDDLWDRAPSPAALDFCLRWQEYGRAIQFGKNDSPYDAEGAYGFGPIPAPRLTPVGSRTEAGVATYEAALRAGMSSHDLAPLDAQLRRSIALLLRNQFVPGPQHLFVDPAAIDGAMPGGLVDWQLRIDYAQHSGSALVRWLSLEAPAR